MTLNLWISTASFPLFSFFAINHKAWYCSKWQQVYFLKSSRKWRRSTLSKGSALSLANERSMLAYQCDLLVFRRTIQFFELRICPLVKWSILRQFFVPPCDHKPYFPFFVKASALRRRISIYISDTSEKIASGPFQSAGSTNGVRSYI